MSTHLLSPSTGRRPFKANRGGHAPGHLREALLDTLDWPDSEYWFERLQEDPDVLIFRNSKMQGEWELMSASEKGDWLCGQLWNCTDILPWMVASDFELTRNTYACLVRHLRTLIPEVTR